MLLIFGAICCHRRCKGRPFRRNPTFTNMRNVNQPRHESNDIQPRHESYDINAFQSGTWSSRYFQYGRWNGPYKFSLSFDSESMKVTGSGSDNIGAFTIDGSYSMTTHRIGLTKQYQAGTGNPKENLGHQVTIQLTWNDQNRQFEGKWYVQTSKYHGEDKFELKFNEQYVSTVYEKATAHIQDFGDASKPSNGDAAPPTGDPVSLKGDM